MTMLRTQNRKGAAAIEFALLLPVFVVIMFGIMEYGWVFFQQANVIASVRDATRYAVTLPQDGDPEPAVGAVDTVRTELLALGFSEGALDAAGTTISAETVGTTPDEVLVVHVSIIYTPLIGLEIVPFPNTINASMTMLLELQD